MTTDERRRGRLSVDSSPPLNEANEQAFPQSSAVPQLRKIPHIRRLILVGLACASLLALGAGVLALHTVTKLWDHNEWVSHTHEVIGELESILSSIKDAETGQRGFLLTGKSEYLEPYDYALRVLPAQQERLGRLVADNPQQVLRFRHLSDQIAVRLQILQQTIDIGHRDPAEAIELVKNGQGKEMMDGIRRQVTSMVQHERALLKDRTEVRRLSLRSTFQWVIVLAGLAIMATGLSVVLLLRKDRQAKSYERQLQNSEAEFRTISNTAPALVWVCDADGRNVYLNDRWYEYTGQTYEQATAFGWADTLHPEDRARFLPAWERCRKTGELYEGECRYRNKAGQYAWHTFRAVPQRNEQGRIEAWYGLSIDITERKQAEEALQRHVRRNELLSTTAARLLESESPQGLVEELCRKAMEFLDCHTFFNFLVDEQAGRLRLNACAGILREEAAQIEWLDYGVAVCGCVARDGRRIVAEDILKSADPLTELVRSYGIQACCGHPLMIQGRVIGTLSFGTRSRPRFTSDDIEVMKAITDLVAVAMHRIQTEQALRDSETRYRSLVERMPAAMYTIDRDGRITFYNDHAVELWGRRPSLGESETRFCSSHKLFWPDGTRLLHDQTPMVNAVQDGTSLHGHEVIIERPDGSRRHVIVYIDPLRDAEGNIVGAVNLFTDITARRQAEQALRDSEERLRVAQAATNIGIFEWDIVSGKVLWSRETERMWGLAEGTYGGTYDDWKRLVYPDDIQQAETIVRKALEHPGVPYVYEHRIVWPDGTIRWIYARANTFHDVNHRPIRIIGINLDITERKQAEEKLRESEERFRTLSDSVPVLVWMNGVEGAEFVNHAYLDFLGVSRQADVSRYSWADYVHPEDREAYVQAYLKAVDAQALFDAEFRFRRYDGQYRWMRSVGRPRLSSGGELLGYVGASYDITEIKNAQDHLRRWSVELEQAVAEKTTKLVQSQERLRAMATELNLAEQRERQRLATELHDHLQQMLVFGKLIIGQGKRVAGSPPECEAVLKRVEDVLSDALTYSRTLVAELSPPVLRDHGLATALKWLAEYMEQKHEQRVTVIVPEDDGFALPQDQRVLLFQCVRELLINASKHAGTGAATVKMIQRQDEVQIQVRDEGSGFDLAAAAAAAGTPSGGISSKFGLFSIQERMRALGGSFDIQSVPGKGTTATLVLPLARSAEDTARNLDLSGIANVCPVSTDSLGSRMEKRTIVQVLLVDDHAMVRQGIRSVLDAYDDLQVVGEARDGAEAVQLVEKLRPRVVVMDINMPKMNGIEATTQIKAQWPEISVVGISINTGDENSDAMKRAGAVTVLAKDSAVEQLHATIVQTIDVVDE